MFRIALELHAHFSEYKISGQPININTPEQNAEISGYKTYEPTILKFLLLTLLLVTKHFVHFEAVNLKGAKRFCKQMAKFYFEKDRSRNSQESRNPWSTSSTYIDVGCFGNLISLTERSGLCLAEASGKV